MSNCKLTLSLTEVKGSMIHDKHLLTTLYCMGGLNKRFPFLVLHELMRLVLLCVATATFDPKRQ